MTYTCGKHLSPVCVENQWAGVDKVGMEKGNTHVYKPQRATVINTQCLQHMRLNINNAYYLFPTRDRWLKAVPRHSRFYSFSRSHSLS
jgi:hypothetical protein